ncbi:MAG TPA: sigma 54-interacting transcriptional regulator [Candidatus Angelobacter sp.]|nr:sigma 54-interacting transcriptional regulator [Candidatus Angelobacter sp.]
MSASGSNSFDLNGLIVLSQPLKKIMRLVEQVAHHPAAVLIVGETGTGKEIIARAIHNFSPRCNYPWIDVNCAAIPEHLVESELFGYEKGAFSGAESLKPGLFELADKGTLFLDEVGDLDLKVQVKLLRVLDGAPYYRLGGSRKVNVDVRVVAATNQDLEEAVRAGRFRGDLYHRLAQFRLAVPPLRERPEDIIGIAEHVLRHHCPGSRFSQDAIDTLLSYSWPGNVRELKNFIFRAVLQATEPKAEFTSDDLQFPEITPQKEGDLTLNGDLDHVERQMIFQALERCGGNQGKAAEMLGISRRTLLRKLKVYRESAAEAAAGALRLEQQRFYRAQLNVPVTMQHADERFPATLLNISLGGAAVATEKPLRFGISLSLAFSIPETEIKAEITGRVAWSNKEGQHGIQFSELHPAMRASLQRWLLNEMKKEAASTNLAG